MQYNKNTIIADQDPWGRPVTMLRDLRVRTMEAIVDTEGVVPDAA